MRLFGAIWANSGCVSPLKGSEDSPSTIGHTLLINPGSIDFGIFLHFHLII